MDKKIFGLILGIAAVLVVATAAMGTITAANFVDVEICNETFHIPSEFKEVNRTNGTNETNVLFEKDINTSIVIGVVPDQNLTDQNLTQSLTDGYVNKTISGVNGVYNDKLHDFSYIKDGKLITISAPDEKIIEEILK